MMVIIVIYKTLIKCKALDSGRHRVILFNGSYKVILHSSTFQMRFSNSHSHEAGLKRRSQAGCRPLAPKPLLWLHGTDVFTAVH